jgi:hypothetical protein
VYVDSVDGSNASSLYTATGAQTPALCRYRSIDDGLAVARSGDTVQLTTDVPAFVLGQLIPAHTRVRPSDTKGNGFIYQPSADVTPAAEPSWPNNSSNFTSDGVTWTQVGTTIFSETATVAVPAGVSVTNDSCASTPTQCVAGPYAVATSSALSQVVTLGSGSSLHGVAVAHLNVPSSGGNGVGCSSGHIQLEQVLILGSGGILLGGNGNGLRITGGCSFDANGLTVAQWQNGVLFNSSSTTTSTLTNAVLGKPDPTSLSAPYGNSRGLEAIAGTLTLSTVLTPANQIGIRLFKDANNPSTAVVTGSIVFSDGNAFAGLSVNGGTLRLSSAEFNNNGTFGAPNAGVSVTQGTFSLADTQVSGNKLEGVVVKAAAQLSVKLDTVTVSNNGAAGVSVNADPPALGNGYSQADLKFIDSDITGNSTDPLLATAGLLLFVPVSVQQFTGTQIHSNKGDQVRVNTGANGGSVTLQANNCDSAIYCYDGNNKGLSQTGTGQVQVQDVAFAHDQPGSSDYSGNVNISGGNCNAVTTCP